MNDRIDQLARASGFKHPDHVGLCEEYAYFDHVKFAELIVRECAKVCDDLQNWPSTEPRHCASDIRIHFGVE